MRASNARTPCALPEDVDARGLIRKIWQSPKSYPLVPSDHAWKGTVSLDYDLSSLSTERKYRPVESYWPYVEKPEEPTAEELAALDPGPAHDAVRSARAAVLDHARVPAVRWREFRQGPRQGEGLPGIHRDRRRRRPPLSGAVFLERRAAVARSLRARRAGARHRGADRRSARAVFARSCGCRCSGFTCSADPCRCRSRNRNSSSR